MSKHFSFIILLFLIGCNPSNTQLKLKMESHIPKGISPNLKKICDKYVADCIVSNSFFGGVSKNKEMSKEEIEALAKKRTEFIENNPTNYMVRTAEDVCIENKITVQLEKDTVSKFLTDMMREYFDYQNK
jgi:cytidylate kinase